MSQLFSYELLVMVLLCDKEIYHDGKEALVCHFLMHTLLWLCFFMCVGSVIHSIDDSQDICFIGGFYVYTHYTSSCLVSNFAVCGMLFLAGFYSRD